ncbi:YALI0B02266p [Yarrowia lipolytica CLIB122]|uniref:YALI0B02266p n=2 Tax=Yarrowia lipolytica TaxID=4952 RepID=Q6CFZ3_YARLI|nr:YALI0B02266p [Yarrowia lipolytica CLIB122]AOW01115.1 hypothetical protein YALI1_B03404g [Yarrowia lipolytica]KAB8285228.1 hypothetical protein BKA91DRAFT_93425 [Yarrowia lipolytica]KAE8174852.1 hypothetical protein BKA90DRAFT_106770 [Yarrowia lipolytica]KAJ8052010.1 hypothetical protein LXG23DRAFT_38071 [Yarrowia lipolytica]RMJ00721.1 hypothetical protein BD777DRAFT_107930 [Yarrowia lipolytica]|eukprot:XP_500419.1 YALI0B02266p [Yarrowia lipolytica CLIB122]
MSYNGPPGQGPPHNTPQQQQQQQQQQQAQQHQQQAQQHQQHQQQQQQHPPQLHHPQHHPHPQHQHPQYMYYPPGHAGHPAHGPPPHQQQQPQQQQHGPPPPQAHPQSHGPPQQQQQQQQHQAPPPPQQQQPSNIPPLAQAHVCICPNVTRVPRPRNAFILYRQHHHSIVVAENPGKSNPEISKIIGEQWRSLAQTEKDFWVQLSDEEKRSHLERFPDYRYQPRRNPKKNGGENNSGVCPVCRGITSAGAGAGNTYSPRHSSGGSSGSVGSIGSMGGSVGGNSSGSFSSISSSHSSFDASSGMPYPPPPPPPPQAALFHPHYPHPAARYSYPTSVEHVAAQTRHNSAPETFSALPRIVPRDELEMEGRDRAASHGQGHQGSVSGPHGPPNSTAPTSAASSSSQPPGKHIKFENTTPKLSSQPLQYSPAFHSPLSLNSLTHRTRLPPTHALIEEDHATKRRRTSSYHDPLAPHHLPQQQRRSVRYKSAIAIASGRISPLVAEEGGPMSMREKADALSMLCEPLPGQVSERSRIVAIEGGGEWGRKVVDSVKEKLSNASVAGTAATEPAKVEPTEAKGKEAEVADKNEAKAETPTEVKSAEAADSKNAPTDSKYSFVTLHNIAGASDTPTTSTNPSTTPANSLACIINQKPDFITDGFASAMWNITCLHQLVSNYFHSAQHKTSQPGVVLLHGYLVTIADKFVQEHLMRQSHTSTYSEEHESEAMERWKRDTSVIPEESESGSPASVGGSGRSPSVAIAPHAGAEHELSRDEPTSATRDPTRESVSHDPVHNAHPHVTSHHQHETRVAELAHESRGSISRDSPHHHGSVSHDPLMSRASVSESVSSASASSYLEEWMSSANLLRGLPAPDILIYLQAEGSELESSAVELRGQGKLVVVRGDDSIFEKVVDKIVHIIEAL